MALSGSATKTVGSHWFLDIEWTATQNVTNNTSTITAKLYWRCDSYGAVSSSATKDGSITIDGDVQTFSGAGLASLSGGQKKLIATKSHTVTHSATGTKSVVVSGMFDMNVSLSGTTYRDQTVTDASTALNTIPRESTLTSSASWTAGGSLSITISRASTSFDHDVKVEVWDSGTASYQVIKTITGIGTTYTWTPSTTEQRYILENCMQDTSSWNQGSRLTLSTMSGSTKIGDNTYTGTVTAPTASTISGGNFTIGASTTVTVGSEKNSGFVYDLTAKLGSYTKTIWSKVNSTSVAWATSSDATSLLGALPTSNSGTVTYTLTTYHVDGTTYTKIRNSTTDTATASVDKVAQAPTFTGAFTFADTNSTTNTVKGAGNEAYIIQGKSILTVTLPTTAYATAKTGTTMKEYQCTVNGNTVTVAHPATAVNLTFTFSADKLNTASNITIIMKAVDNRLNTTTTSKVATVVPYSIPTITSTALRQSGFEAPTTIELSGTISTLSTNGVNKNSIVSMKYEYKLKSASSYPTSGSGFLTTMTSATATFPAYKANAVTPTLDNLQAWTVQVYVQDKLGTYTKEVSVPIGQPIMFMDSNKKSIGVNMMPTFDNSFEITGVIKSGNSSSYLNFNNSALVANDGGANGNTAGVNFDHIWHDDTNNEWNFCSDTTYKGTANASVKSHKIRLLSTTDVTLTSTAHGFQLGADSGLNIRMDTNEIQAVNNGVASQLNINILGGEVVMGGDLTASGTVKGKLYHDSNYLYVGSYSSSYGTGYGRMWYNHDSTTFEFWNQSGGLATVKAYAHVTSKRETKTNIVELQTGVLDKIRKTNVYNFQLKQDFYITEMEDDSNPDEVVYVGMKDPSEVNVRTGLIYEESPEDITFDGAIDLYGMSSMLWKAVQELADEVDYLKEKMKR